MVALAIGFAGALFAPPLELHWEEAGAPVALGCFLKNSFIRSASTCFLWWASVASLSASIASFSAFFACVFAAFWRCFFVCAAALDAVPLRGVALVVTDAAVVACLPFERGTSAPEPGRAAKGFEEAQALLEGASGVALLPLSTAATGVGHESEPR